uniref:Uncharacterized protein n=1 Tax=Glossina pallidipes TaxID=7398 RepID=A0A1B0A7Z2_GLOPL
MRNLRNCPILLGIFLSILLESIRISRFCKFMISSGNFCRPFVAKFNSTIFTQVPTSKGKATLVNCAGPPVGKLANALRERVMVVRALNAANKPSGSCVMPLPSTLNSSIFLQFFRLDVRCMQSLTAGGITVIDDLLKSKRFMPTKVEFMACTYKIYSSRVLKNCDDNNSCC